MQVGKHQENFQLSNQHELLNTNHLRELRAQDCVGIHSKDVTLDAWKVLSQQGKDITSFQDPPWRSNYRPQSFFPSWLWFLGLLLGAQGGSVQHGFWFLSWSSRGSTGDTLRETWAHSSLLSSSVGGSGIVYLFPVLPSSHWRLVCTGPSWTMEVGGRAHLRSVK